MMIFYHIEQMILKIMIFVSIAMVGFFVTAYSIGFENIQKYKVAIALITLVAFVLYLIPKGKPKFGEHSHFYKEVAKMSPELAAQHKITSEAILKTVYRPGRAVPRLILLIIQLALLVFMLRMVFAPFFR